MASGIAVRHLLAAGLIAVLGLGVSLPDASAQPAPQPRTLEAYNGEILSRVEAGQYRAATPIAEEALMAAAERLGQNHPNTLTLLSTLAFLYQRTGRFEESERLYVDAVNRMLATIGPDDPETLRTLSNLATLYGDLGVYDRAIELLEMARDGRVRTLGPEHRDTLNSLNALASVRHSAGALAEAEAGYIEVLAIAERTLGDEHADTLLIVNNLAQLFSDTGRTDLAEPLLVRVLDVRERVLGPDHLDTLVSANNLAGLHSETGALVAAEPLLLRALAGFEAQLGQNHPNTLTALSNLAELYARLGRSDTARPLLVDALQRRQLILGPDHPDTLISASNLASLYASTGEVEAADALYRETLEIALERVGPNHPISLTVLNNAANFYRAEGRIREASRLYHQALEGAEASFGPAHPSTVLALSNLAGLRAQADTGALGERPERLWASLGDRLEAYAERFALEEPDGEALTNPVSPPRLARRVGAAYRFMLTSGDIAGADTAFLDPAFTVSQAFMFSSSADALRASTAALTVNDPALRALVETANAATAELESAEAALSIVQARPLAQQRTGALIAARARVDAALSNLQAAQSHLGQADLDLADLAVGRTADRSAVQAVLAPDEALILISQAPDDDALLAFVVTPDAAAAIPLSLAADTLADLVAQLRAGLALDPGPDYQLSTADIREQAFDLAAAKALHDGIFAPLRPHLGHAQRLLVVADGPLQTLPLHVLVSELPDERVRGFARYRAARWLADEFAISRLPAVSSLVALRQEDARQAGGARSMLAFGDPVLAGYEDRPAPQTPSDRVFLQFANASGAMSLEALPALRETGVLLNEVRAALSLGPDDVFLGPDAIEAALFRLNDDGALRQYRSLAFATHALINDEIEGLDEPAIVLTPTPDSDGLLRASEVVQLKLDAGLVILAACNTAAADGSPGSEALSGLAKAFFYAGARSLLVSNWPAEASATAELIPDLISAIEAERLPRSIALQRAMNRLRDEHAFDFYAHPALWAPYMVVADG